MGYEIVKSISLKKDVLGGYYASVLSADSNIYPHRYERWDYCKGKMLSKEEVIKNILLDYYHGNFHKGSNDFRLAANLMAGMYNETLGTNTRYNKVSHVLSEVFDHLYNTNNKLTETRQQELRRVTMKLSEEKDEITKEYLYLSYKESQNIKGIFVKEKNVDTCPYYVKKINRCSYNISVEKTLITSKVDIARVIAEPKNWWNKNFDVEIVYK